jgi:putative salt-induced outer membrane protein
VLRRFQVFFLTAFLVLASSLFADQVTLKNGDRLTGTVVKSDGKTLVLHTEAAGDVTIQFGAIQEIKTEQELHVTLKGGKTAVGPVTTTDGKLEIATKTAGTVEAPAGDVTLIRNDAEQTAYDKSLHPGLRHGWTGGANVGFSVARGNSETENLALAFNAAHATLNDKITLYASSIDTTNNLATPSTVANLNTGGLRYDRNVNPKLFVFGAADYSANALQFLDLRSVYTGGFGYHAIKSDQTTLNFLGGINYTHEVYSNGLEVPPTPPSIIPTGVFESYGKTNRFVALTLGEELTQKLGKSTGVTENFYFYPNLQQTGQYRTNFNIGTVTKISKWLGWQNQFGDVYVSNPPASTKNNDVIFTTGLNFSFAH